MLARAAPPEGRARSQAAPVPPAVIAARQTMSRVNTLPSDASGPSRSRVAGECVGGGRSAAHERLDVPGVLRTLERERGVARAAAPLRARHQRDDLLQVAQLRIEAHDRACDEQVHVHGDHTLEQRQRSDQVFANIAPWVAVMARGSMCARPFSTDVRRRRGPKSSTAGRIQSRAVMSALPRRLTLRKSREAQNHQRPG